MSPASAPKKDTLEDLVLRVEALEATAAARRNLNEARLRGILTLALTNYGAGVLRWDLAAAEATAREVIDRFGGDGEPPFPETLEEAVLLYHAVMARRLREGAPIPPPTSVPTT